MHWSPIAYAALLAAGKLMHMLVPPPPGDPPNVGGVTCVSRLGANRANQANPYQVTLKMTFAMRG